MGIEAALGLGIAIGAAAVKALGKVKAKIRDFLSEEVKTILGEQGS